MPPIDYSKFLKGDLVDYAALAVEKATIQKSLADEHYLLNDLDRAKASYKAAQATLDSQAPDESLSAMMKSVKRLLLVDIRYRLLNISMGNDFWSGFRTNRPTTPHKQLIVLEDLIASLEKQADELNVLLTKGELDAAALARVQGMRIELEGKIKDQSLGQERASIQVRQQRGLLNTWDERAKNLTSQRLAIEARANQLAQEQKQLSANASAMLVQAVATGTGVPPSAVTAVVTGNVKAALLQEATAQLGDPNSPISKAVADVSSNAQQLRDLYVTASENYAALKQNGETLKQAADLIRKPTFEGLASAGEALWAKLPPGDRQRLTLRVMDAVPAAGLLEAYRRADIVASDATLLRRRIETLALQRIPMQQIRADLLTMARQVVKNEEEARGQFRAVFKSISSINLTDDELKVYVERFVRVGASDVFATIPVELRQKVAEQMGEPNIESAIRKLEARGIASLPKGRISNDRIILEVGGKRLEVGIKQLFAGSKLDQATAGLKELPSLYEEMTKTQPLYRIALAQLPTDMLGVAVETALRREQDVEQRKEIVSNLAAGMSPDSVSMARQLLVNEALGSTVVADLVKRKEAAPHLAVPSIYPASGGSTTGLSPQASAAATAALNYAVPGAGLALSLAQSFAQMDAISSETNRLADQNLRIMAEQEQIFDLAREAYVQHAIANVEEQRAIVLRDSADRQLKVYSEELDRRANSAQKVHVALGLRRGLTYYLAERMREEFDLFDRSFAMWRTGLAAQGVVAATIEKDPRNTRYALDSDIHLFGWLNRERESTRGDPDMLRIHWRQMVQLAKDICTLHGCKPGDGNLGQIGATGLLSMRNTLVTPTEWQRFKDWQKNPSGQFVMQFSILPSNRLVPLQYENIRIIDLRLAGQTSDKTSVLAQVALKHMGLSQIPRADAVHGSGLVFQREALLPKQASLFQGPSDFDVDKLRERYNGYHSVVNYPTMRDFEGYGLYAVYQLTLQNNAQNRAIDDLLLNVAYYYNDASNIISEERYQNSLREADSGLPFEIYDYQLVSKMAPSCTGSNSRGAVTTETRVITIPTDVRTSLSNAFARRTAAVEAKPLDFLREDDRRRLEGLRSCMETRVEKVCKPMAEISRIAASWAAANSAEPAAVREIEFDVHRGTDVSKVPQPYRDRYEQLCQ